MSVPPVRTHLAALLVLCACGTADPPMTPAPVVPVQRVRTLPSLRSRPLAHHPVADPWQPGEGALPTLADLPPRETVVGWAHAGMPEDLADPSWRGLTEAVVPRADWVLPDGRRVRFDARVHGLVERVEEGARALADVRARQASPPPWKAADGAWLDGVRRAAEAVGPGHGQVGDRARVSALIELVAWRVVTAPDDPPPEVAQAVVRVMYTGLRWRILSEAVGLHAEAVARAAPRVPDAPSEARAWLDAAVVWRVQGD